MGTISEMNKWIALSESILTEESDKLNKHEEYMQKLDSDLMTAKIEKLNALVKQKYYKQDQDIDDAAVFQFKFEDKGDFYEFTMPLYILFGRKSREFTAQYWNSFFGQADIAVSFEDNIEEALKSAGRFSLTMKINKKLNAEVEDKKKDGEA
jgi:hypothetical protein